MIRRLFIVVCVLALMVVGIVAALMHRSQTPPLATSQPLPATLPTTNPTHHRAPKPKYPGYMEVLKKQNPNLAATQPLDVPLDLSDSAHLVLHDPVYLDPIGNLWITRPDGQPTAKALEKPGETEEHIIIDQPIFVHWWIDEIGNWQAAVVVRTAVGVSGTGLDVITKTERKHLADDRGFRWETAFSILNKFVVTTHTGVSVFEVLPKIQEFYHPLPGCGPATNPPVVTLDTRGILAWAPWENGKSGSQGISRFVDEKWMELPANDWPQRPIQLSMLLDGSVLRIAAGMPAATAPVEGVVDTEPADQFPDQVHLSIGQLEATPLDEKRVTDLIQQLNDPDSEKRQTAFDELSRYGPSIAPLLEKVADDQLPEARTRLQQLLRNKLTPALGGLMPVDNRLDVIKRCADGTVIFFAPSGVRIPTEREEPDLVNPAWLALRPDGRMDRPLPAALIRDQTPEACSIFSIRDEWIMNDDAGPRRLVGNAFESLLSPTEKRFNQLVGLSTRRRWVFSSSSTNALDKETLIIDPLIADPTPRLPTWTIVATKGIAGWDADNFPAVSRTNEAGAQTGNWALNETGWKQMVPPAKVLTHIEKSGEKSSEKSLVGKPISTTAATTSPTTGPVEIPILIGSDSTQYFDGRSTLRAMKRGGESVTWTLPAVANGSLDPTLIQTQSGLLFLYNQPGRLLRIRPTPGEAEPFKLEATFTKDIPSDDHPARIWLDPAGRINFVTEDNILTVTFPSGTIPKEISRMMLDARP